MSEPMPNNETEEDTESDRSDTDQENELEVGSHGDPSTSDITRLVHNFMVNHINHVLCF